CTCSSPRTTATAAPRWSSRPPRPTSSIPSSPKKSRASPPPSKADSRELFAGSPLGGKPRPRRRPMTTRQILLSLMLTIAAGCGAPTPEDATVEQATSTGGTTVATGTTTVTVTAQTLAALPPAQHYLIDPTRTNIVYRFHPTFGPIDFSRVG